MPRAARRWLSLALALALFLPAQPSFAQTQGVLQPQAVLERMSPEERVGQLFLVSFMGTQANADTQIYDLIANQHVGGVMFQRSNDNLTATEDLPGQAALLSATLQAAESNATAQDPTKNYVPLFVGISQEGGQNAYDQLLSGVTPLPNEMAIGATWNRDLARQVGDAMGRELNALGFNLYLGPSLDVLESPALQAGEDLGVRTFGGDPYWVGEMGKAYIQGLQAGSQGQMAVIAKNFPGRGSSDRQPEEEVATVRKTLDQLKQIELAPFFSVTGMENPVDGLLVSHIRYQGLQGNIRSTTRPVSFDGTSLDQILALEPLNQWRQAGGLMVSDNLGSAAVRGFYDPTGQSFDGRQVARNAFLAGNDLLYTDQFVSNDDPDQYTTLLRTLEFFAQKYREDPAFAERVDASVLRILTVKLRLYPNFVVEDVTPTADQKALVGASQQVAFEVARQSATLIDPPAAELADVLASPPGARDRMVFLSDVAAERQCSSCQENIIFGVDSLKDSVLRLYGPRAGGQVNASLLSSYSFEDVERMLAGSEEKSQTEEDLRLASWIVVGMRGVQTERPTSRVFQRLLAERPDLMRGKRVVVFSFAAPYFLDSTELSKVTAYYGLYSYTAGFVDVAARLLFQELSPMGSAPVSVTGAGYDLLEAVSPEPSQLIPLSLDIPEPDLEATLTAPAATVTVAPTQVPTFKVGDTLPLRTGVILDHNGNPVPDGTVVRFLFTTSGETPLTQMVEQTTTDGVARASFRIDRTGLLEIRATSDPAQLSSVLQLNINPNESAAITAIAPTEFPTATPEPTLTPTITPTLEPTPIPTPEPRTSPSGGEWVLAVLVAATIAAGAFLMGLLRMDLRWGLRIGLTGVIGGMAAYNYLALGFPGSALLLTHYGTVGVVLFTLTGGVLGLTAGWIWRQRQRE